MKLWLLRPVEGLPTDMSPWEPWYDKAFGFVVRADSEAQARELAAEDPGDEAPMAWLNSDLSTCVELTAKGSMGIVIKDFSAA